MIKARAGVLQWSVGGFVEFVVYVNVGQLQSIVGLNSRYEVVIVYFGGFFFLLDSVGCVEFVDLRRLCVDCFDGWRFRGVVVSFHGGLVVLSAACSIIQSKSSAFFSRLLGSIDRGLDTFYVKLVILGLVACNMSTCRRCGVRFSRCAWKPVCYCMRRRRHMLPPLCPAACSCFGTGRAPPSSV